MEGVEAVEVEKLYAFVRAFLGIHLKFTIMRCLSFRQARIQVFFVWGKVRPSLFRHSNPISHWLVSKGVQCLKLTIHDKKFKI